jgi:hypothetical protein
MPRHAGKRDRRGTAPTDDPALPGPVYMAYRSLRRTGR